MDTVAPLPTLTHLTHAAWARTQEFLPSWASLYEDAYWNADTGQGLCAHASAWLHLLLSLEGIPAQIASVQGNIIGHSFVVCHGFRLDPTAMQFGAPGPVIEYHDQGNTCPWYYLNPMLHPSILALCIHLDTQGSPSPQTPSYLMDVEAKLGQGDHFTLAPVP